MVNKIKKYLKFVVCCALIMSLVVPSYAALSASDGSAFVTKAEFDAALADFNSRLTTFEAGINSKIDSQVTSYLDRNGIWNGKSLVSTSVTAPVRFDFCDLYATSTSGTFISYASVFSTTPKGLQTVTNQNDYAWFLKNDPGYLSLTLVNEVTKSGLVAAVMATRIEASGSKTHWNGTYFDLDGSWSKKFYELPLSHQTFKSFVEQRYTGSSGYGAPGIEVTNTSLKNGWYPWCFVSELRIEDDAGNVKWSTYLWELPANNMMIHDSVTQGRAPVPFNRDAHIYLPYFFAEKNDRLFLKWNCFVTGRDSDGKVALSFSHIPSTTHTGIQDNILSVYVMSEDIKVY